MPSCSSWVHSVNTRLIVCTASGCPTGRLLIARNGCVSQQTAAAECLSVQRAQARQDCCSAAVPLLRVQYDVFSLFLKYPPLSHLDSWSPMKVFRALLKSKTLQWSGGGFQPTDERSNNMYCRSATPGPLRSSHHAPVFVCIACCTAEVLYCRSLPELTYGHEIQRAVCLQILPPCVEGDEF